MASLRSSLHSLAFAVAFGLGVSTASAGEGMGRVPSHEVARAFVYLGVPQTATRHEMMEAAKRRLVRAEAEFDAGKRDASWYKDQCDEVAKAVYFINGYHVSNMNYPVMVLVAAKYLKVWPDGTFKEFASAHERKSAEPDVNSNELDEMVKILNAYRTHVILIKNDQNPFVEPSDYASTGARRSPTSVPQRTVQAPALHSAPEVWLAKARDKLGMGDVPLEKVLEEVEKALGEGYVQEVAALKTQLLQRDNLAHRLASRATPTDPDVAAPFVHAEPEVWERGTRRLLGLPLDAPDEAVTRAANALEAKRSVPHKVHSFALRADRAYAEIVRRQLAAASHNTPSQHRH